MRISAEFEQTVLRQQPSHAKHVYVDAGHPAILFVPVRNSWQLIVESHTTSYSNTLC